MPNKIFTFFLALVSTFPTTPHFGVAAFLFQELGVLISHLKMYSETLMRKSTVPTSGIQSVFAMLVD